MFNSEIIDVAIGLVFVYLLLSLMCSAANEIIELWLKNRAADLERGLRELLKDKDGTGLVKDLYSHHLVNGLFKGTYDHASYSGFLGRVKRLLGMGSLPSYIPARNFALALMDLVPRAAAASAEATRTQPAGKDGADIKTAAVGAPSGAANATASPTAAPASPQVIVNIEGSSGPEVKTAADSATTTTAGSASLDNLRNAIQGLPSIEVRQALTALVDAAGNDAVRARLNIEDWFNSSMDRVSGWYKRRSQIIVLAIALIVSVGVNADSLAITKRLWTDRALRESLVSAADAYAKANATVSPSPTPTPTPTAGSPTAKASPSPKASPTPKASPSPLTPGTTATPTPTPETSPCWYKECEGNKDSPQCKLKKAQCEIGGLGLPIGWPPPDDKTAPEEKWPGLHFWTSEFWSNWVIQIRIHGFGWLLTAFALSLGAPFWFDMLNKFIVVRSTVKPKEKSPEEKSKD